MQRMSVDSVPPTWEETIAQAVRHRQHQRLIETELALGLALEQSAHHPHPYWARARTYLLLALMRADQSDLTDARLCLALAIYNLTQQLGLSIDSHIQFWEDVVNGSAAYADQSVLLNGHQQLLSLHESTHGPQSACVAQAKLALGEFLIQRQQLDDAEAPIRDALSIWTDLGDMHQAETVAPWLALSRIAYAQGRLEQADACGHHALKSADAEMKNRIVVVNTIRRHLAVIAVARGQWEQAHGLRVRVAIEQVRA